MASKRELQGEFTNVKYERKTHLTVIKNSAEQGEAHWPKLTLSFGPKNVYLI